MFYLLPFKFAGKLLDKETTPLKVYDSSVVINLTYRPNHDKTVTDCTLLL